MREVTVTRMVLTPEEREIRSSWGNVWVRMQRECRKNGFVTLLFGDWSGYRSSQYRITHIDYIFPNEAKNLKLRTVQFTDCTVMNVWTEKVTIESILARGLKRRQGYTSLISEAMASGEGFYSVGAHLKEASA